VGNRSRFLAVTVLVLAQELDRTADNVVEGLAVRSVPVFRLDTSYFPQRLTVDAELSGGRWGGRFATEHRELDLETVRAGGSLPARYEAGGPISAYRLIAGPVRMPGESE